MTESEEFEQRLRLRAKALFRQQEQALDEETCAALRQARMRAVASSAAPRIRVPRLAWALSVGAAASLLALAVLLIPDADFAGPPDAMYVVAVTDVALLLAGDDWALYEDMDFFAVLGALDDEDAEPGSS